MSENNHNKPRLSALLPGKERVQKLIPGYKSAASFFSKKIYWSLEKGPVARGLTIGFFCAWMPPYIMQMLMAAIIAIPARANLPAAIVGVWFSNPFTTPIFVVAAYYTGAWILPSFAEKITFSSTTQLLEQLFTEYELITVIFTGSLVLGIINAVIVYALVHLLWREKKQA